MILTLWNDYAEDEGSKLANTINAGNIVLAMWVKVTTFHGLSLSTRAASSILINPPTPEAIGLKQWYLQNKPFVADLIATKAYKNTSLLLPSPHPDDIKTVQTLISPNNKIQTTWIEGSVALGYVQQPLWFGACMHCLKKFELPVHSEIRCSSCNRDSQILARARIPITIEDKTGSIAAVAYGEDAEKLIMKTGVQLQTADAQGENLVEDIENGINGAHVVCFIRSFESNGTTYSVVKLYIDDDLQDYILPVENERVTEESPANIQPGEESEMQTANPKACIQAVAGETMGKDDALASKPLTRRALNFKNEKNTIDNVDDCQGAECSGTYPTKKIVAE